MVHPPQQPLTPPSNKTPFPGHYAESLESLRRGIVRGFQITGLCLKGKWDPNTLLPSPGSPLPLPFLPSLLLARTRDFFDQAFLQCSKMKRPLLSCQVCKVFCYGRIQPAQIPPRIWCPNTTAPLSWLETSDPGWPHRRNPPFLSWLAKTVGNSELQ